MWRGRRGEARKITRPCTGDAPTSDWSASSPAGPACPIAGQSAKRVAINATVRTSRCAHGSGRGAHATPSGPRQSACTGAAACVTAVSASGTDGNQLRQHRALLKCPVRRGGGACSGLSARQGPTTSRLYSETVCEQQCLHARVFTVAVATSRRNERRMFGSQNGIVFARCRLCRPHRVRSRQGKSEQPTTSIFPSSWLASYLAKLANCPNRNVAEQVPTLLQHVTSAIVRCCSALHVLSSDGA